MDATERHPIDDARAEQAIIGQLLLWPALIVPIYGDKDPAEFVVPLHRRVFEVLMTVVEAGIEPCPFMLASELRETGLIAGDVPSAEFIVACVGEALRDALVDAETEPPEPTTAMSAFAFERTSYGAETDTERR
jgi:hypothetical protein